MTAASTLPDGVRVLERGWLSSNNILCSGDDRAVSVIDTGYGSHSQQTVALVAAALNGGVVSQIACTHLHSDHCGGVAALKRAHPNAAVWIPPGEASIVQDWEASRLRYAATDQLCEQFHFDALLQPGTVWPAGTCRWQVLAAPGHDPHSVVLYEPQLELLVSADALWEDGFGVVFPEIDGIDAFDEVHDTLDMIAGLRVRTVIPGHGGPFSDVGGALERASLRLSVFRSNPARHASHAAKVLTKFKLLEWQRIELERLLEWIEQTPSFVAIQQRYFSAASPRDFATGLVDSLVKAGAAKSHGAFVENAERS